jgi:hypothetical protein
VSNLSGNLYQDTVNDPAVVGDVATAKAAQRLATRMKLALGSMPGLSQTPSALLTLATSPLDDASLVHQTASYTAAADMDSFMKVIKGSSPEAQRYMWTTLTEQQRRAASQLGYQPPQRSEGNMLSGVLGPVAKPLAAVVGGAVGAVEAATGPIVGPTLEGLQWMADQPAHAYRAIATDESAVPWLVGLGAVAGGVAAAPFTGGLSLGLTAAAIGGAGILGATAGAAVTSPGDWWDAYSSSWDGERTFKPHSQRQARGIVNSDQVTNLAKDVAWASNPPSPYELATELAGVRDSTDPLVYERSIQRVADQAFTPGTPQHETFYGQLRTLATDPTFKSAVQTLQEGKVSPGRDMVEQFGVDPSSGWGRVISGGTDALWVMTLDPTLALGKTAEAWKVARYAAETTIVDGHKALDAARTVEKMRDLYGRDKAVTRAYDMMAEAATDGDFTKVRTMMSHNQSAYLPLRDWMADRRLTSIGGSDVLDFYGDQAQMANLLGGRGVRAGESVTMIPHLNRAGSAWGKVKGAMGVAFDAASDSDLAKMLNRVADAGEEELRVAQTAALPPAVADRLGFSAGNAAGELGLPYRAVRALADLPVVGYPIRKAGALAEGLTTMVPAEGVVNLVGPNAATQIDQLADLQKIGGMQSWVRRAWRDFILEQGNDAQRMEAIRSMLDTSFRIGGMDKIRGGPEIIDKFVNGFGKAYALGSDATVLTPLGELPVGKNILLDQAYEVPIPNLTEMRRAVQRSGLLHDVLGVTDSHMVDVAMNRIWKPAVLLRVGFIPRAAGEELLAFLARGGLGAYAGQFAARSLGQEEAYKAADSAAELLGREALSKGQANALDHYRYLAHVRPLERMANRLGFQTVPQRILGGYTDFVRSTLAEGLAPAFEKSLSPRWRQLIAPDASIRGLLLRGVDPDLAAAAKAWETWAGPSIMREVGSTTTGPWAPDFAGKGYGKLVRKMDPVTGEISEDWLMPIRGRFARHYAEKDPLFMSAVHETYSRAIDDPFQAPAITDFFSRYVPASVDQAQVSSALGDLGRIGDPALRQVIVEAATGSPSVRHVQAAVSRIKDDAARGAVAAFLPLGDYTAEGVMGAARRGVAVLEAKMPRPQGLEPALDRLTGFLDGLDSGDRRQVALLLHAHHGSTDVPQWLGDADLGPTLVNGLTDQAGRAEWTQTLTRSRSAMYSPQGFPVANAPRSTDVRLYVPTASAGTLASLAAGGAGTKYEELATKVRAFMTSTGDQYGLSRWEHVDDFLRQLTAAGPEALSSMATSAANLGFGVTPLTHMAVDDPRLARSLTRALENESGAIAYADVPQRVRMYRTGPEFGVHRPRVDAEGHHAWYLQDEQIQGRLQMVPSDTPLTDLGTDGWQPGVSFESATAERMRRRATELEQMFRAGLREDRVIPHAVREISIGEDGKIVETAHSGIHASNGQELTPGTVVNGDQVLKDSVGNHIPMDDVPWEHRLQDNGEQRIMHEIFAPMVMDRIDDSLGRLTLEDNVRVLRSDVRHVIESKGTDLPNVALGPVYGDLNGQDSTWAKFVKFGFNRVIGPSIDAIIRKPLAFHNFARHYGTIVNDLKWLRNPELMDAVDNLAARYSAPADVIPAVSRLVEGAGEGKVATADDAAAWIRSLGDGTLPGAKAELERRAAQFRLRAAHTPNPDGAAALGTLGDEHAAVAGEIHNLWNSSTSTSGDALLDVWREVVPPAARPRNPTTWSRSLKDDVARNAGPMADVFMDPDNAKLLHAASEDLGRVESKAKDIALERAINETVPYIDSHKFRSQFADHGRNLMPFWYAEENFLKRWGKTLRIAPEAIERGRLAYSGMRSAGVVRTDAAGRDWFVYPGSGLLVEALGRLPFVGDVLPVGATFQTAPSSMLPGFQRFGAPSFTPLVSMPVDFVASQFPEMASPERALLGDNGVNRGFLKAFVPTSVMNLFEAFTADESNSRFGSAMMSAAQVLQANGQGLPENATDLQVEDFLRKLRDHARTIMIAQAFTSTIVPGSPTAVNTGGGNSLAAQLSGVGIQSPTDVMSSQYRTLVRNMGIDEGTIEYLKLHPDANPWNTFSALAYAEPFSKSASGARIPITGESVKFYADNEQWMHDMPDAGPWFIPPQPPGTPQADQVDRQAYDALLADELRLRQSPEDFVRGMYFRAAGQSYFAAQTSYKEQLAKSVRPEQKRMVQATWDRWQQVYLAAHPVFASDLQTGDGRIRRAKTIEQMTAAVNDPQAPVAWHTPALKTLQNSFNDYQALNVQYSADRSNRMVRRKEALKVQFSDWVSRYVLTHPEVEPYWSTVLQPEANLS